MKSGNAIDLTAYMTKKLAVLRDHLEKLRTCKACPEMIGPVVVGQPALSKVMLIGQAPGVKEGQFGKPFAWTAGKTLFKWFSTIGVTEEEFRQRVYMAAVCRCFPGKSKNGGGDRVPSPQEVNRCANWLKVELELLKPELIIPVGKLAISQLLVGDLKLDQIIGKVHQTKHGRQTIDVIPLPHPSGASPWHRMSPGKELLRRALKLIERHAVFEKISR